MKTGEHLLKLVAIAAAIVSLLPLGAEYYWGLDLLAQFRVQYLLIDTLLLAALAWQRRWNWSGAMLACAALNAVWIAPYVPIGPKAAVAATAVPEVRLKIMSSNVYFHNSQTYRLLDVVREESPDVLVVIEYAHDWAARVGADLRATYPYHIEAPAPGAGGIGLFSRYPLETADVFLLGVTRAIEARLRTPNGPLTVYGIHTRSPTSARRGAHRNRQLDLLADRLAKVQGPVAVIGDLNITPYSPFYRRFIERTGYVDTRMGRTLSTSWPTYLPVLAIPIDHCIVSPDVTILAHRRMHGVGSDHYPILAEIALPGAHTGISNN
jgi:endonuclease/exonuclease/phosphatase (EEP) superfamily protein YafD